LEARARRPASSQAIASYRSMERRSAGGPPRKFRSCCAALQARRSRLRFSMQDPTPITLKLVRASIHHSAIKRAALLPSSVGYVALTVFSDSTARELKTTVDSLVQAGATSLVLDLRANPGGLLDQGVAVADLFLDRGERVASTAGRDSSDNVVFTDTAAQRWPKLTVAILVDDKSASAAEVVAGALQDHDRAVVLGMTTYG